MLFLDRKKMTKIFLVHKHHILISVIETLMYLANYTRSNIAFIINLLSKI